MAMYEGFVSSVVKELEDILGVAVTLPIAYEQKISKIGEFLSGKDLFDSRARRQKFLARINWKFRVNSPAVSKVYARAAKSGVTFNFHQKNEIQAAFDNSSEARYKKAIANRNVDKSLLAELISMFMPASEGETIAALKSEFVQPSKLRNDREAQDVKGDIILSALSAFVYSFADEKVMHSYFDKEFDEEKYDQSFWVQLRKTHPELYSRDQSLEFINVAAFSKLGLCTYEDLRAQLLQRLVESYRALNNHGYLALWLSPMEVGGRAVTWELASDLILFGEKFDQCELKKGYFRPGKISIETANCIPGIVPELANFEIANEGFSYRDTFVCSEGPDAAFGTESILVLLQKNQRDETLVPCPSCRAHEVGGNSYPSLGVKSWECGNLLCPDKSKYNRGKRYSFKSLLMQEAIDDDLNEIPQSLVRGWSRDVQVARSAEDALEMVLRFYSLYGDSIHVYGMECAQNGFGRVIVSHPVERVDVSSVVTDFWDSPWFHRYIITDNAEPQPVDSSSYSGKGFHLVHGDARSALMDMGECRFDAAITSPPYYNAREYSQWNNIYCYMYDMYNIAIEVFRTLKSGAIYMYNIFDYFDNENSLAHSAMGNKRIPLSAYTVDAFRRAGFTLLGNVTWDKGDIEGKRGFNAGNFSPYYQAPFNCWEHILVFVKGSVSDATAQGIRSKLNSVLRASPVIKMIGGENVHGHTAPFPEQLPNLLSNLVPSGAEVLDPFGGSGTTARALVPKKINVTCIERDEQYCKLSRRLFDNSTQRTGMQLGLGV